MTATVYEAIKAYIADQWATPLPIAWENESFDPPIDANSRLLPWVAIEIFGTLYAQTSIGAGEQAENRWDEEGVLWMHVMVAKGKGSLLARQHADRLADLFRGARLLNDNLEFGDASIGGGGPGDDEGNYWMLSISVEWRLSDS